MDINKLKNEIVNDPLVRGYAAMSNAEVATDMMTVRRIKNKATLTGSEVLNAIPKADLFALSAADSSRVWDVLHLAAINPFGVEADIIIDVFGAGSPAILALADLRTEDVSRAEEIGLGSVYEGHVEGARA